MARAASNAAIGRQATIEEKSLSERNLLGCLRIVGRYRRVSPGDGDADLLADLLTKLGRGEEAERLRRFGLNPDGSIACA